jgi:uncharacterized protein YbbC (DUF1343 family)
MHPVPVRHGMTLGELAQMINGESWLENGIKADLTVIAYEGKIDEKVKAHAFNIPPSPNMPNVETAWLYQGLCLLEGTSLSEGRGTDLPFKLIGAPWLDNQKLFDQLVKNKHPLDDFEITQFTPQSIPAAKYPKYDGEDCFGLRINNLENPIEWTIQLLAVIKTLHPQQFKFLESNFIDKLYGSDRLRVFISGNKNINILIGNFQNHKEEFLRKREDYLIYDLPDNQSK